VCALAAGATALTDVEALTWQEELYGPAGGASDTTVLRGLDELADRLAGNGLPGRACPGRWPGHGSRRGRRSLTGTVGCPLSGSRDRAAPPGR
jgi:hypothetical protein